MRRQSDAQALRRHAEVVSARRADELAADRNAPRRRGLAADHRAFKQLARSLRGRALIPAISCGHLSVGPSLVPDIMNRHVRVMTDVAGGSIYSCGGYRANRPRAYGSGQLMIGTELMLFFGLPSMTRSL
jgi:hypothetical protein